MPYFDPTPRIISQSLEELRFIFSWVKDHGETSEDPITVLIGGWAVDAYNPWYGSVDIDLVTNSRTKNSLKYALKNDRGYGTYEMWGESNSVSKQIDDSNIKEIIIDFISREPIKFQGNLADFDFNIPIEQTAIKEIRGEVLAVVPKRSLLFLMKLKAAWDRTYRIRHNKCYNEDWERGKLVKDYADIIALIDPGHGGSELEIEFLGEKLNDYDFPKKCLENIPKNFDAIRKYGRMTQDDVKDTIGQLLSLIG
ncbi:MAG: hypothetical protein MIO93_08405 [ANME-2 cluster archaeon]|nr:hypothetical protein [ANME-2 cluster archaeon]